MEGRSVDEAHERHLIGQMTEAERRDGFRAEVRRVAAKWGFDDRAIGRMFFDPPLPSVILPDGSVCDPNKRRPQGRTHGCGDEQHFDSPQAGMTYCQSCRGYRLD